MVPGTLEAAIRQSTTSFSSKSHSPPPPHVFLYLPCCAGRFGSSPVPPPAQEPVLFATSIADNIAYGREGATQEEARWLYDRSAVVCLVQWCCPFCCSRASYSMWTNIGCCHNRTVACGQFVIFLVSASCLSRQQLSASTLDVGCLMHDKPLAKPTQEVLR